LHTLSSPLLTNASFVLSPDHRTLATNPGDSTVLLWDLAEGLDGQADIRKLWDGLGSLDGATAYRAIWGLAASPRETDDWFGPRLRAAEPHDHRPIADLIADLDSERFAFRETASRQLRRRAVEARSGAQAALAARPSPEARRRLEAILAGPPFVRDPQMPRMARGVQVLERIGSPAAKEVVWRLAGGFSDAPITRDARAALDRLNHGGSSKP
jgi:hypothetical protein